MPTETSHSSRWRLATLALVMLLPSLGTSIANVALPTLKVSFTASSQDVQWVVIAYLLAVTSLIVTAGRLGDLLGRRRLLLVGIAIFAIAWAGGAFAPSLWALVAARAVQGVGAALMMALVVALVGDIVPRGRTGSAMGLLGTVSAVGTALGPSLGGLLIAWFGWPAVFAVMAVGSAVALLLALRTLPADHQVQSQRPSLDMAGVVLLALSLAGYALSMTLEVVPQIRAALVALSVFGLAAFVAVELRTASPLIQLRRLRDAELTTGLASLGLVSAVVMATLVVGPFYLSGALGLSPLETGLVMSVGPVVAALTGLPAGRVVDHLGSLMVIRTGLGGVALGSGLMAVLPGVLGVGGYVASLALLTLSYALFLAATNTAVMNEAATDQRGVTSALLALARNLGLVTGASAMGALYALGASGAEVLEQAPGGAAGLRLTFTVAAALAAVALLITSWGHVQQSAAR